MASYDSPRSNSSLSLHPPGGGVLPPSQNLKQQRRMTSPAMSSQNSLSLPDGGRQPSPRPPSPLRNSFTFDSFTGVDPNDHLDGSDDEDHNKWNRSPSPASSVSNIAASFVQRMNNFVGNISAAPRSPNALPSDEQLEAEAERERERSRREAEAILTREAQQRKLVEERVLSMMDNAKSLPPPPANTYTEPTTPSPSNSQKEKMAWWQAAKKRLSSKEKDPPTPAQQVILDAKAREKEKADDSRSGEKEWPTNAHTLYNEGANNLNPPIQPPIRKPAPPSPSSPTPSRPSLSAPNLSPSPMRNADSAANSPSREAPPLYAQFTPQGTLDVPGTLLAIANRFEKLEKWTVGHVRALEDRMNDVERWLVEKEKEREEKSSSKEEKSKETSSSPISPEIQQDLHEIREEISELQGRVGELGREMAKMATAPSNLSAGPKAQIAAVSIAPRTASTQLVHETPELPNPPITPRHSRLASTARDSTSPPLASNKTPSGTRLPYPAGDYNSPPDTFSPTSSPPASLDRASRNRALSISGLPMSAYTGSENSLTRASSPPVIPASIIPTTQSLTGSLERTSSPVSTAKTTSTSQSAATLPPPKPVAKQRQTSVSPTPRKRYTVALGGPIVAPPSPEFQTNAPEQQAARRIGTPKTSAKALPSDNEEDENDYEMEGEETIGKTASAKLTRSLATKRSTTSLNSLNSLNGNTGDRRADKEKNEPVASAPSFKRGGDYKSPPSPTPVMSARKQRAQSAYGYSSIQAMSNNTNTTDLTNLNTKTTQPLRLKVRTRSTETLNSDTSLSAGSAGITTATGNKFVDPLLLRRQEANSSKPIAMPKPVGKLPKVGQLVAFFDKDKKENA